MLDSGLGLSIAQRSSNRMYSRGFTLIELMVSLLIIGIVLTLTMLSLPGDQGRDRQRTEVHRLLALLQLARDEAILQAKTVGFAITDDGYGFYSHDGEDWRYLEDDAVLRPRQLPTDIGLHLTIEGEDYPDHESNEIPELLLWPTGEISAFRLIVLSHENSAEFELEGSVDGMMEITEPE